MKMLVIDKRKREEDAFFGTLPVGSGFSIDGTCYLKINDSGVSPNAIKLLSYPTPLTIKADRFVKLVKVTVTIENAD